MDNVHTPAAVDTIADLSQFGEKAVVASRLAVSADTVYLLDSSSNAVIAVTLASSEKRVVFAEDKEAKQGRPLTLAYLGDSDLGKQVLLIVDAARALWAYAPESGLRQVALLMPEGMTVSDIAVANRALYVLDANESTIYRFAPGAGGFGTAPETVLTTPDLAAARRLMVDEEIITSDANGTLHRFAGQLSLVLSEAGIDRKLAAAEPPQALGDSGDIAVLDAEADRIAVFRRDGTFDRQYRHKDFAAISAFAVYEGAGYIFSGGMLRRVTW
jgi:hypothetical protein